MTAVKWDSCVKNTKNNGKDYIKMILNQKNEIKKGQTFKVIIIGPPGSGKSSLVNRYIKKQFLAEYTPTIGVQFCSKLLTLGSETYKLQIWDTAGQQTFRSIVKSFYKNSVAVLLVYNIANRQSFQDVQYWYLEALANCGEDCVFGLVGAQKDLDDQRKVSIEDAAHFAKERNLAFTMEVSSKINENVQKLFQETTKHILSKKTPKKLRPIEINPTLFQTQTQTQTNLNQLNQNQVNPIDKPLQTNSNPQSTSTKIELNQNQSQSQNMVGGRSRCWC